MRVTERKINSTSFLPIQITNRRGAAGTILAILSILFLLGTSAAQRVQAQTTYTILHSFSSAANDGGPGAGVVLDNAGNIYGTSPDALHGGVFKLDPSGSEVFYYHFPLSIYYSYGGHNCFSMPVIYAPDGFASYAPLAIDAAGNLFGTTAYGGANGYECTPSGYGTDGDGAVFELNPSTNPPAETVIHSFTSQIQFYGSPGLALDAAGNVYGISADGGPFSIFRWNATDGYTVLYTFPPGSIGFNPPSKLAVDAAGNIFGTAGGIVPGGGVVFELVNSSGTYTEKVLYNFAGATPGGGLTIDASGNLYGVTGNGGGSTNCLGGCGTVFELVNASGSYTKKALYVFPGGNAGADPNGELLLDAAGNLYGTAMAGGNTSLDGGYGGGVVFEVNPSGTETVLHTFGSFTGDGISGEGVGGLAMDTTGNLYGATSGGGDYGNGTVFKLTMPQLATLAIVKQVNGLMAQGAINKGQANSLVKKLQNAIGMIYAGKTNGAIGKLGAFINEVNALVNSRRLTGTQGSALINAAKSVVAQLI